MKLRHTTAGTAALAVSLVVMAGCGTNRPMTTSKETTANVVRATERQRLHALLTHDLDTARRLHADAFELINPLGETISKEAYIDSGDAFAYTVFRPVSAIRVRVDGDSAVIRYESVIEIHGSRGHYWHTDLYEQRNGQWQIVWSQATSAP